MLTGSFARAYHGAGRAMMDIDLVIDSLPDQLDTFVRTMAASGMYVSDVAAREALASRSMFNVIATQSGWKVGIPHSRDTPRASAILDVLTTIRQQACGTRRRSDDDRQA